MKDSSTPVQLGMGSGPWDGVKRWLVLAPHPDDFDVVAVTLKHFSEKGADLELDVLSGGASGVEDVYAADWEAKTSAREEEQRDSCMAFGLPLEKLRFHRLTEDEEGYMADIEENQKRVHEVLDFHKPEGVILPHGHDSNADHRRTYRWFVAWCEGQEKAPVALLVKDPKTLEMEVDLITPYGGEVMEWKADLLRRHRSQHERNLRSRGIGFDERIIGSDRKAGVEYGFEAVESFELWKQE